ncbi:MAG: hypothetical protein N3A66_09980, partial [Planctomycetota bacterium]|nr:hypothetical protein [Planctomycetota bacterium]
TEICPVFAATPDYASIQRPNRWRRSSAEAMEILKSVGSRIKTMAVKIQRLSRDEKGNEKSLAGEWEGTFDANLNAFLSRKQGEDFVEICDGSRRIRMFPLLKYAASRLAAPRDLQALCHALPGFLMPWADALEREWVASVEKREGKAVVIKLANRHGSQFSYMLLFLESEAGPVTRIEVYQPGRVNNAVTAVLVEGVVAEEIQEINGVRVPVGYRIQRGNASQPIQVDPKPGVAEKTKGEALAAITPSGSIEIARLLDLKVNFQSDAAMFKAEIPADWAVRDLDAAPLPAECRPLSPLFNPSQAEWGRAGNRIWRRE